MQSEEPEILESAPDWDAIGTELHCPLCDYNLRGLNNPRCPECGFVFTWAELKRGQEEMHPYLFEHQPKRNVWSFWKTYWHNCLPLTFWTDLSPAQPVRKRRLMIYWVISSVIMISAVVTQLGYSVWYEFEYPPAPAIAMLVGYPVPLGGVLPVSPPLPVPTFWDKVGDAWSAALDDCLRHSVFVGALTVLVWPWLTMLCLLVFAESMRKAMINKQHVLRVIIYGTDFGFVMLIPILMGNHVRYTEGFPLLIALLCAAFTLYRATIAYTRYLRFHMPFATVLSSQIIVLLVFLIVYVRVVQH